MARTTRKRTSTKAAPRTAAKGRSAQAPARRGRPVKAEVKLLSGGNPQVAKAEGQAPVRAYIAAMGTSAPWKRRVGRTLDDLITRAVPGVRKAVKWNSPFYGVDGAGWFLSFHTFARYIKVAFFRGSSLQPPPPGPSKSKDTRYLDIYENDPIDKAQFTDWVRQAAALPGWTP